MRGRDFHSHWFFRATTDGGHTQTFLAGFSPLVVFVSQDPLGWWCPLHSCNHVVPVGWHYHPQPPSNLTRSVCTLLQRVFLRRSATSESSLGMALQLGGKIRAANWQVLAKFVRFFMLRNDVSEFDIAMLSHSHGYNCVTVLIA